MADSTGFLCGAELLPSLHTNGTIIHAVRLPAVFQDDNNANALTEPDLDLVGYPTPPTTAASSVVGMSGVPIGGKEKLPGGGELQADTMSPGLARFGIRSVQWGWNQSMGPPWPHPCARSARDFFDLWTSKTSPTRA